MMSTNYSRTVCVVLSAFFAAGGSSQPLLADENPDWQNAKQLHPGIRLIQENATEPRPLQVHCVRIDLKTPGLVLCTTPRAAEWSEDKTETVRQATRDFIRSSRSTSHPLVFASNADAFSPWPAPWNERTPTNLSGLAVHEGTVVSPPSGSPSLLISKTGEASIQVTTPELATESNPDRCQRFCPLPDRRGASAVGQRSSSTHWIGVVGGWTVLVPHGDRWTPLLAARGYDSGARSMAEAILRRRRHQYGWRWLNHVGMVEPGGAG